MAKLYDFDGIATIENSAQLTLGYEDQLLIAHKAVLSMHQDNLIADYVSELSNNLFAQILVS